MSNQASTLNSKIIFTARQLAFCGASIGLAFVLSNIKFTKLPMGGSITLFSMLVACLPGFWFGPILGIISGIAYGLLNLIVDPYILFPAQVIVDYILAFAALGLSGFFAKSKNGLLKGYGIGCLFFGEYAADYNMSPLPYSLIYNGIYIFAEAFVTYIVLILPPIRTLMDYIKRMATTK